MLPTEVKGKYFSGFKLTEVMTSKQINLRKTIILRGLLANVSVKHTIRGKKIWLINIANTYFMKSVIQYLNSVTPLVQMLQDVACSHALQQDISRMIILGSKHHKFPTAPVRRTWLHMSIAYP